MDFLKKLINKQIKCVSIVASKKPFTFFTRNNENVCLKKRRDKRTS